MPNCQHECQKEQILKEQISQIKENKKDIDQLKIDVAVGKSDMKMVKDDISELKKGNETINDKLDKTTYYLIGILLTIVGTFAYDKFF